jgi:hypothetical protein
MASVTVTVRQSDGTGPSDPGGNTGGGTGPGEPGGNTGGGDKPDTPKPEYGTVNPVTDSGTPSQNGVIERTIGFTDSKGLSVPVVEWADTDRTDAALQKLQDMGLEAEIVNGKIVIGGTATDIGTVVLDVVLDNGETTTVTFEVKPIEHDSAPAIDTNPSRWSGTVAETANAEGLRAFTVHVPLDMTESEASQAADESAKAENGDVKSAKITVGDIAALAKKSAANDVFVRIAGTAADPKAVTIREIAYRIGIHRYTQQLNAKLSDVPLSPVPPTDDPDTPDDTPDETSDGSGGGCESGSGTAMGLAGLLLAGFMIRKRTKSQRQA